MLTTPTRGHGADTEIEARTHLLQCPYFWGGKATPAREKMAAQRRGSTAALGDDQ